MIWVEMRLECSLHRRALSHRHFPIRDPELPDIHAVRQVGIEPFNIVAGDADKLVSSGRMICFHNISGSVCEVYREWVVFHGSVSASGFL
jgi:hypothetical protein